MAGGCHLAHSGQATPPQYTNGNPPQSHQGAQPGASIIPRLLISPPSQSSWQVTLPQETVAGQGATQRNTTQLGERRRAPSSSTGRNGKGGTHAAAVAALSLAQGLSSSLAVAAGGSQAVASRRSGRGGKAKPGAAPPQAIGGKRDHRHLTPSDDIQTDGLTNPPSPSAQKDSPKRPKSAVLPPPPPLSLPSYSKSLS
uniref:Uncharacterized protein n=1 Tax=Chromera velia CCMP2878 TaxID=1169474 RepID=A0A0G4EZN3_9ALVE|eukprot:Cvel_14244.t1-p1 / transcript=Cvel_14244.t1 / gene=Cvel_14244 / organism=Chromera_velia_CCMP2878 / gene_product=hypothetical protein / transcript_product=hypothetical protein / location=Cvel_scaffold1005:28445-29035(+) / protein_length=197 / sequence_SO=supercontig / SO=protein_coding / is_pseudo=false